MATGGMTAAHSLFYMSSFGAALLFATSSTGEVAREHYFVSLLRESLRQLVRGLFLIRKNQKKVSMVY
jgi:hypothetical protein